MLDRVAPADGDIMVVVAVPVTSYQRPDTLGGRIVAGGGRSSMSSAEDHRLEASPEGRHDSECPEAAQPSCRTDPS